MKTIEIFETIMGEKRNPCMAGSNATMYWAYVESKEAGNDLIDFHEVIWEEDIPEIVRICRENDITEFTISCTFSSLIETLAEFEKRGCKMFCLMQVKAPYKDWRTNENAIIPAIKMVL